MGYFKCTILFNICTTSFLSCYDIGCTMFRYHVYGLLISELAKIGAMKPIFLDSGSPRGERGFVCACVGMVCYHCIVYILNSSKNSIFFFSHSDLCSAILPNYLGTYSSALCQIRALWMHWRSKRMAKVYQNLGFECMHLTGQNKHSKFTYNTLRIFASDNDLCRGVLTNLLGDIFFNFLPHLNLEKGVWEE